MSTGNANITTHSFSLPTTIGQTLLVSVITGCGPSPIAYSVLINLAPNAGGNNITNVFTTPTTYGLNPLCPGTSTPYTDVTINWNGKSNNVNVQYAGQKLTSFSTITETRSCSDIPPNALINNCPATPTTPTNNQSMWSRYWWLWLLLILLIIFLIFWAMSSRKAVQPTTTVITTHHL